MPQRAGCAREEHRAPQAETCLTDKKALLLATDRKNTTAMNETMTTNPIESIRKSHGQNRTEPNRTEQKPERRPTDRGSPGQWMHIPRRKERIYQIHPSIQRSTIWLSKLCRLFFPSTFYSTRACHGAVFAAPDLSHRAEEDTNRIESRRHRKQSFSDPSITATQLALPYPQAGVGRPPGGDLRVFRVAGQRRNPTTTAAAVVVVVVSTASASVPPLEGRHEPPALEVVNVDEAVGVAPQQEGFLIGGEARHEGPSPGGPKDPLDCPVVAVEDQGVPLLRVNEDLVAAGIEIHLPE
eukprot:CAMPEP_0201263968 /NCGR_PEP_ID=MMETSP0853-20130426/7686_1 /ASSEMBLY_ACC=CAM_ASM_000640 /TAXON_ID=183588 /ORGANISM="Pseudo-nitzschia fraudulenta, Strain WWA7" /LENGTH=295 /DNA_ID=CAMNT_0047567737 /DNA_START=322 /DNA_END=1206 /DNA_ORIENTATION=+